MKKLVSLVVTLVVAVGLFGGGTYSNGKTLVMGGGFGHQYALIQGEDIQIVTNIQSNAI